MKKSSPKGGPLARASATALVLTFWLVGPPGSRPDGATFGPPHARAESGGAQLRRARLALLRGAEAEAERSLQRARAAAPESVRGLEAAMLLADLYVSTGRPGDADAVLEDAVERDVRDLAPVLRLARGWLALHRGDTEAARASFDTCRTSSSSLARSAADIGLAWSALAAGRPASNLDALRDWVRSEQPVALRLGAAWTLARAYGTAGEHRRALRELRAVRRAARRSPYEDDLELSIGMAQLSAGRTRDALRTFRRLDRKFGRRSKSAGVARGLALDDLRERPDALIARVGKLYAERTERSVGLLAFLSALLDRDAGADAPAAILLAENARAAEKGGAR